MSAEGPAAREVDAHAVLAALEQARSAAGDPAATVRALRGVPEGLLTADPGTFSEVLELVGTAARTAGFDDLAAAAERARRSPDDAHALYGYGYACVERGIAFLAVPALALALRHAPDAATVRLELVSALEAEARHADAVGVLAGSDALEHWTGRYLLVVNLLLSGDLDGARQWSTRLGPPQGDGQHAMAARVEAMLGRVAVLTGTERLDVPHAPDGERDLLGPADLRGWHYALNGGVLATLSPYGADAGMNGRYAYLAETWSSCRWVLHRLAVVLEAAGRRPAAVALLPDRSSRVLGLAAAELLGLPARDWDPLAEDVLTVAYSLSGLKTRVLGGLRDARGQVLVEHATSWTDPPPLAADVTGFLHQVVVPPWAARRVPDGDGWRDEPPDDRPEGQLAADLLAAEPQPDPGDGTAPPDGDDALRLFVDRVSGHWARPGAARDRVWSPGPVPSARFW